MRSRSFCLSVAFLAIGAATVFASDPEAKPSVPRHQQHKKSHKKHSSAAAPLASAANRPPLTPVRPVAQAASPSAQPNATINSAWNGGTGNWNVNGDWTPGTGFPNNGGGNTYDVTIATGSDNVSLNTNVTISSLTLGTSSGTSVLQNLAGSSETLTDLGALTVNSAGQLVFANASTLTAGAGGSNAGLLDLEQGSKATITGSFTNSGTIETNRYNGGPATPNTFTVTGALTNTASGTLIVGNNSNTTDVMNLGSLANSGVVAIDEGATLNLTAQPTGLTDVAGGSQLYVEGTFKAGAASGLSQLGSVEGLLALENNQSTTITPGGGTLTVSSSGTFDVERSSTVSISGAVNNSGEFETNRYNLGGGDLITVTGAFTNNAGATLNLGNNSNTTDVMNVGSLANSGVVAIDEGATLNLTAQPNGITDVAAGSQLYVEGTFKAGSASALAKLGSVEGFLALENNQTTTMTPGGGTLTVSNSGTFDVERYSTLTISGAVNNSGYFETNRFNLGGGDLVTVTGAFTNQAGATLNLGNNSNTTDVMNVGSLANSGVVAIDEGATLNLTAQPNGITDVAAGSQLYVEGTFKAGAASALAQLGSVEGLLALENNQSTTITPGGGTLTVSNSGTFDVDRSSTVSISGAVNNSGEFETNRLNLGGGDLVTVTGAFTNNAGATLNLGNNNNTTDVMNVASLANSGIVSIDEGATLNLTAQPNGITDVAAGSQLYVEGTFKAGAASALAKLGSVEGLLSLENNQSTTITPGGGTLTVSNSGTFDVDRASTVTISGAVNNSGYFETNRLNLGGGDLVTVTGAFTNNAGATLNLGNNNNTTDVMNVASLANSGIVSIDEGATLNLTAQPNGITDVAAGSQLYVEGAFKAGTASALAKLGSVEGLLSLENNQSTTITPGGGTLTISSSGTFDVDRASTVTISGAVNNSGYFETNRLNLGGGDLVTVSGAFTNNAGATLNLGNNNNTNDVMNVGSLANSGIVSIDEGATLNLTAQPNGLTDVAAGSQLYVEGTFKAGAASALAKLGSVEGLVTLENNQSTTITPGSGTLTISNSGTFDVDRGSSATITGAVNNSGEFETNRLNLGGGDLVTVTGAFTNNAGATVLLGNNNNTTDVMNVGTLANSGTVDVQQGTTFNLTSSGASTNAGAIDLTSSTLKISGANVTLSGAGAITLSNASNNLITGSAPTNTFTNGTTIQGSGTISNMGIVNTGTISANQSTPLLILPSSLGLNNKGTLSVLTGDTMQIGTSAGGALTNLSGTTLTGGTYSVGGTMQFGATGSSIVTDAANISLTGAGAQLINFGGQSLLTNLATITSAGSLTFGSSWGTFTTTGNFTNDGTLSVGAGDKFIVDLSDSLTNFSGTTLTGGVYKITGTLEFDGANIVTNDASITLTGAGSKIDGKAGANGLANFAVNAVGASFTLGKGRSFTTAGNFTNNGLLTVGSGDTFDVNGNLTNFSGSTLTGGNYNVSGTLQFNGANIVSNAATITLGSTTAKILNQSSANALLGFTTNTAAGKFTLSGNAGLATAGGSFTNAGLFTISTGSAFTVGGSSFNFTQTSGTSTVDGTLSNTGSGALDLNGGNLYGTGTLNYGVVDAATITPGNSATSTGKLQVDGTYAQSTAGALDVTVGGITAGTKYDQLNVSGAASLNGVLNITLAAGFTPTLGSTFDILNASSITGTFSTVNGLAINGSEHFTVTTVSGDEIVLTVVSGAATAPSASLSQSLHPGRVSGGRQLATVGGSTLAPIFAPVGAPVHTPVPMPVAMPGFHPRDDFGSPLAVSSASGPSGSPSIGALSAAAFNPMAAMNHMRFECGVDVNALLKTSPKRLLRGLWASPDSPNAVNVGYMALTTR